LPLAAALSLEPYTIFRVARIWSYTNKAASKPARQQALFGLLRRYVNHPRNAKAVADHSETRRWVTTVRSALRQSAAAASRASSRNRRSLRRSTTRRSSNRRRGARQSHRPRARDAIPDHKRDVAAVPYSVPRSY